MAEMALVAAVHGVDLVAAVAELTLVDAVDEMTLVTVVHGRYGPGCYGD